MINEIINSIRSQLYDRASNPLTGSFVISWSLWNYKIFLTIFSALSVQGKVEFIDQVLYPTPYSFILQCVIYPLLTSLAYIYVYPIPSIKIFKYHKEKQKQLIELKNEIEGGTLITEKAARKLRSDHYLLQNNYEETIDGLRGEIKILKEENKKVKESKPLLTQKDIDELKNKAEQSDKNSGESNNLIPLTQIAQKCLYLITNTDKRYISNDLFIELFQRSKAPILSINHGLDELQKHNFTNFVQNNYYPTPEGRGYMIELLKTNPFNKEELEFLDHFLKQI